VPDDTYVYRASSIAERAEAAGTST
jgi:hypothetical protein